MNFEYLEVRPFTESKAEGSIVSYRDEDEFSKEVERLAKSGVSFSTGWTMYGICGGESVAIGDFVSKAVAHDIMNGILAPMAAARDIIDAGSAPYRTAEELAERIRKASSELEDFILQSSDDERI